MNTPSKRKKRDRPLPTAVSGTLKYSLLNAASLLGRAGGKVKVPKGFARMDPAKRIQAMKRSLATRRANARKRRANEKA
jgi:hypothetical protein